MPIFISNYHAKEKDNAPKLIGMNKVFNGERLKSQRSDEERLYRTVNVPDYKLKGVTPIYS